MRSPCPWNTVTGAHADPEGHTLTLAWCCFLACPLSCLGSVHWVHVDTAWGAGRQVTAHLCPDLHSPVCVSSTTRAPNLCLLICLPP